MIIIDQCILKTAGAAQGETAAVLQFEGCRDVIRIPEPRIIRIGCGRVDSVKYIFSEFKLAAAAADDRDLMRNCTVEMIT